ncbi:(deoxy)nucleoside triphosphate pyrophosphohydrolase [Marinicella litoralis]|uniref:8-oxo-dGTP diphosphatase n=1 Tax=Marinicella litoralis TaxID=644220 RepID=A0A4R6XP95_9GAMM|nr:(deoxy)nucleoside triphosphate pyrophosphohydrolase [Marinicella litoralis]TDR19577.1 8-oxo-dGTPase [Marinicella litoralis]
MSRQIELNQPQQIVVLVLENSQGDILLTQRQAGKHLEGYWEFPGGKVEAPESLLEALERESLEEINYQPINPTLLIKLTHSYPNKTVQLHVYHCLAHNPQVHANEKQAMIWHHKSKLSSVKLPAANLKIINLLNK